MQDNVLKIITDDRSVQQVQDVITCCKSIALDSEFLRYDHFLPPKLALLQLKTDKIRCVIDPLMCDVSGLLEQIFQNNEMVKIFHDGRQDIEVLASMIDFKDEYFDSIADTQVFELFISYYKSGTPSYKDLVTKYCHKPVNKDLQNSKWLKRPLTDKQIQYAITDVEYLADIYNIQLEKLKKLDRYYIAKDHLKSVIYNHVKKIKHEKIADFLVDMDEVNKLYRRLHNNCEDKAISPSIVLTKQDIKKIVNDPDDVHLYEEWRLNFIK